MAEASFSQVLGGIPQGLRAELVNEYNSLLRNFREGRWRAAELDAGHFCEIVYTVLKGRIEGSYPTSASKPRGFDKACQRLENATGQPDSVRLTIPRVLIGLYDVRNRRGVGHTGGEVDANEMDAAFVVHSCQWVMAELVRVFHETDLPTAAKAVESLTERLVPILWRVGDVTRVLDLSLSLEEATLVLLYSETAPQQDKALARNLEQGSLGNYRRVLTRLHAARQVEFDRETSLVTISVKGIQRVEDEVLGRARV